MIKIILPRMADRFSEQQGAIFGFGPKATEDTGTVLSMTTVEEPKRRKSSKAQVHNLNEERSVGFINYEISIKVKRFLETASRKMLINKCKDILDKTDPSEMKKYNMPAKEIKEIKLQWQERLKEQQTKDFSKKEKSSLHQESQKYNLLELLKKEELQGPFVSEDKVMKYMALKIDDKIKNTRLYNEVRYAQMTCMSLKLTAAVFQLKKNHHNLSNEEHSQNLISYFSSARCCKQITISDLCNVMQGIMGRSEAVPTNTNEISSSSVGAIYQKESEIVQGEHVIAFWVEGNKTKWYSGIVETKKNVSYIIHE